MRSRQRANKSQSHSVVVGGRYLFHCQLRNCVIISYFICELSFYGLHHEPAKERHLTTSDENGNEDATVGQTTLWYAPLHTLAHSCTMQDGVARSLCVQFSHQHTTSSWRCVARHKLHYARAQLRRRRRRCFSSLQSRPSRIIVVVVGVYG